MVPNYIKVSEVYQPLTYFTSDELTVIGEAWTQCLIARKSEQAKAL